MYTIAIVGIELNIKLVKAALVKEFFGHQIHKIFVSTEVWFYAPYYLSNRGTTRVEGARGEREAITSRYAGGISW